MIEFHQSHTMRNRTNIVVFSLLGALVLAVAGCDSGSQSGAAADGYPLKTCVVSDEPLDSMGGPVAIQHDGKTVKFCCEGCIDDFKKNPTPYLDKLTQVFAK
jgi:YHS domain-containing protein